MKKLKLAALSLGAKEVLTRAQLKSVYGGSGSAPGSDFGSGSDGGGSSGGGSCSSSFASCCVDCPGGGVNIDCGFGVTCTVIGTKAGCGNATPTERCKPAA